MEKEHWKSCHDSNKSKVTLPLHLACSIGKRNFVKKTVDSVPVRELEIKDELGKTPLILCITNPHTECASLLLKAGVHVNNCDFSGQTALHVAVHNGHHRGVKLLLSYNANCLQKDIYGVTPLHLAAIHTNTKCLNTILKDTKSGEVDIQDTSKRTPLHWSTAYSNYENTKSLLMKGSNICIPDVEGKTPLHWAATSCKPNALECVKILLDKEGNLVDWQDYEGRTALHLAVATGSAEVVRFLVCREGCDVDVPDNSFCTPMHWAAKRGLYDKVDILLNGGACYSSADGKHASPLHYAAYNNYAKAVRVFLSRKYVTERDVKDEEGRNALIWAAAQKADDVVNIMAENGIDLVEGDSNKVTALHAAAIQGHASTVELLLNLQVPVDLRDKYGMTPLLRACEYGRSKTAQILMNNGADIHAKDVNKRTALHWCALGGHAYICQVLLHKDALCSAQDVFGMTALHYACMKNGFLNCVSVLLESEADPNVVDIKGWMPLHWAVMSKHQGVVRLLCEYDADVNAMALRDVWVTPLDLAVSKGESSLEIAKLLKMYGALSGRDIEEIAATKIQNFYLSYKCRKNRVSNRSNVKQTVLKSTDSVLKSCQYMIDNFEESYFSNDKDPFPLATEMVGENTENFNQLLKEKYFKNNPETWMKNNYSAGVNIDFEAQTSSVTPKEESERDILLSNTGILKRCQQIIDETNINTNNEVLLNYQQSIKSLKTHTSNSQTFNYMDSTGSFAFEVPDTMLPLMSKNSNSKVWNKNYIVSNQTRNVEKEAAKVIQRAWRRWALKMRFIKMRKHVQSKFKSDKERSQAESLWNSKLHYFYNQW